jgi:signal transduction histidine kinase
VRWPIRFQLLFPTLFVVVLTIILASVASAYFGSIYARRNENENLRRVVATLTQAPFPFVESVLRQMRGLSGDEFVLLDQAGRVHASTLQLSSNELEHLRGIGGDGQSNELVAGPTITLGGHVYLSQHVSVALRDSRPLAGSLIVLCPKERWSAVVWQAAYPAIIAGAGAVAIVILVTTLLAHRFVRPIHDLRRHAASIAQGDFQPVAIFRRDDEIRDLAISINQMSEQLAQYEERVRRHERLRVLGQLGAGMAHQLRNAATGGRMAIELHQRRCHVEDAGESLDIALRQLRLMESYLQRLLAFGQDQPAVQETVALSALVVDALTLVRPMCEHAGVDVVFKQPAVPLDVCGDAQALRQLIANLVLNALDATRGEPEQAAITVDLERLDDSVAIRVFDSGEGPATEVADRLFEPFVTSKPEGVGLGLYVARRVVESHRGSLDWRRVDGKTCFSAVIPLQYSS